MTKKKKITIGIISLILALVLIASALMVILTSKFKVKNYSDITYYNHTAASTINIDANYDRPFTNSYYENGTQLIKDNAGKWGLFSSITGKVVVNTNYHDYTILHNNSETNKTYFKFFNSADLSDGFAIYDEHGNKIFGTNRLEGDSYEKVVKARVVTRTVDIEDNFELEQEVEKVEVKDITFGKSFIGDNYHYESWIITDKKDVKYANLYNMSEGRKLVQTFGNNVGQNIGENIDFVNKIHFLTSGEFVFIHEENKTISSTSKKVLKFYDSKLQLKNTIELENPTELSDIIRIGDYLFIQRITAGTEDNYDFKYASIDDQYYNLDTYKINMKSGKYSNISAEFIIEDTISTEGDFATSLFDVNNIIVKAYQIEDKIINKTKLILVNSKLESMDIDYTFDTIECISKNRYLVSTNDTSNFTLINKKFEVIANLNNYTNVFTTKDNIIVSDNDYTYICNHDGLVIKRYNVGDIINIHHKDYYLVRETSSTTSENFSHYYQGSNGEKIKLILTENDTTNVGDKINNEKTYSYITAKITDDYAYMIACQENGSKGNFSIYNFNGEELLKFELPSQNINIDHYVYDNHIIVRIGTYSFLMDR